MRFIFILCFSLLIIDGSMTAAFAFVDTQEKMEKNRPTRIFMSKSLTDKMKSITEMYEAKDFDGVFRAANKTLKSKKATVIEQFWMHRFLALVAQERKEDAKAKEHLVATYKAGLSLPLNYNQGVIPLIVKLSFSLKQYEDMLYWLDTFEAEYKNSNREISFLRARAYTSLGRWPEAKEVFAQTLLRFESAIWNTKVYIWMIRTAIRKQDREFLLGVASIIEEKKINPNMGPARSLINNDSKDLTNALVKLMYVDIPENIKNTDFEKKIVGRNYQAKASNVQYLPLIKVRPQYPRKAAEQGICGYVAVKFTVTKRGEVNDINILESSPKKIFDNAAKKAISKFRYKPRLINGNRVETKNVKFKLDFKLAGGCKE